jgi:chromosome segregation ATPase
MQEHPAQMGKRNRRREASSDWEANGSDESVNASGNRSITELPAAGAVGESGDSIDDGQTDNQNGGGRSRRGKGRSPSQRKHKSTLGPWTHAVGEAVQEMGAAQRAINNLQGMFTMHMDDLGIVDDIKRRIGQLEEQGREKDTVIQEQKATISTLRAMDQEAMAAIESDRAQIERSKEELEQDKAKLATRISVATAEEKHKMKRDFAERTARQDKNHETRMKELNAEFARKIEENSTKVTALEAEKERLLVTVKQQEERLKAQADELYQLKDQYDVLKRAKDSFRSEKEGLERELEKIKKEFALDNKSAAYLYAF